MTSAYMRSSYRISNAEFLSVCSYKTRIVTCLTWTLLYNNKLV